MSIEIVEIQPTLLEVTPLADAAQLDMGRAYEWAAQGATFTPEQQAEIDDALTAVTPERSLGRVERNPGQYFRAELASRAIAFARFNTWRPIDQANYEKGAARTLEVIKSKTPIINTRGVFGVHSLFAANPEGDIEENEEGFDILIKHAIDLARGREIRIGVPDGDPIEEILDENLFEPTDKVTSGVTHVPQLVQRLFVRSNVN